MGEFESKIAIWADGGLTLGGSTAFPGLGRTMLYQEMAAGRLEYRKHGTRRIISKRSLVLLMAAGSPGRAAHIPASDRAA